MIKEPGPVFCVGGCPKDVHHHEVLDVKLLPPRLFQLVNIVPANRKQDQDQDSSKWSKPANPLHLSDHWQVHRNLVLTAWHLPVSKDVQEILLGSDRSTTSTGKIMMIYLRLENNDTGKVMIIYLRPERRGRDLFDKRRGNHILQNFGQR